MGKKYGKTMVINAMVEAWFIMVLFHSLQPSFWYLILNVFIVVVVVVVVIGVVEKGYVNTVRQINMPLPHVSFKIR